MRCEAQSILLELGTGDPIFAHDFNRLQSIATHCWMKSAWQFFHRYGICMVTDLPTLQLQCPGDRFLVPEFARLYPEHLEVLNNCRKYLQVSSLAEIVTAD
jgi:hypothetical protein